MLLQEDRLFVDVEPPTLGLANVDALTAAAGVLLDNLLGLSQSPISADVNARERRQDLHTGHAELQRLLLDRVEHLLRVLGRTKVHEEGLRGMRVDVGVAQILEILGHELLDVPDFLALQDILGELRERHALVRRIELIACVSARAGVDPRLESIDAVRVLDRGLREQRHIASNAAEA